MPAWGCCWREPESSSEEESESEESGSSEEGEESSGSEEKSSSEEEEDTRHELEGLHLAEHVPALAAGAAAGAAVAAGTAVAAAAANGQQQAPSAYPPYPPAAAPYASPPAPAAYAAPAAPVAPYSMPDGRQQAVAAAHYGTHNGSGHELEDSDEEEGAVRRLADYRPPHYTVTDAHLTFRLHPEETVVDALLTICATGPASPGYGPPPLVLDGARLGWRGGVHVVNTLVPCRLPPCSRRQISKLTHFLVSATACSTGRKDLRLVSVSIDGHPLVPGQYLHSPKALTIPFAMLPPAAGQPGAQFQVATRVLLCPRSNTHLEVRG